MTSHHLPWERLIVRLALVVSLEIALLSFAKLIMDYPIEQ